MVIAHILHWPKINDSYHQSKDLQSSDVVRFIVGSCLKLMLPGCDSSGNTTCQTKARLSEYGRSLAKCGLWILKVFFILKTPIHMEKLCTFQ